MTKVSRAGEGVALALSRDDAMLVRTLAGQVVALLDEPDPHGQTDPAVDPLEEMVGFTGEAVAAPEDPALRRLLPDAYAGDDSAAAEFRRLMDADLRRTKVAALRRILADGERRQVQLSPDDAEEWLRGLNDVRLVLGVRLDVQEDMDDLVASLRPDDPRLPLLYAYDRLTRIQDALLDALDTDPAD
ncbi:MAG TPA: DUF2017 domain-containing protein [Mycobacteriales bacterium]|nr:DUF2017 domain-containing protein [Mycobacteriales bacterium]